jgi:hypothetical protein
LQDHETTGFALYVPAEPVPTHFGLQETLVFGIPAVFVAPDFSSHTADVQPATFANRRDGFDATAFAQECGFLHQTDGSAASASSRDVSVLSGTLF